MKMKIELVKVGTFGEHTITEKDLDELVETYKGDVPITLGHTLADFMPAFGWVKSVEKQNGSLIGEIELNDLLREAFEQGLYKKWSVGIRRDPATGKKYLHHVAFLGAIPSKIKDLKVFQTINMADAEERWEFARTKSTDTSDEEKPDPPSLWDLEIVDVKWNHDQAVKRVLEKYGFKGLKEYSLYQDPEADPETKSAYKFLVVDIIDGEPKIVAKALSAAMAYLHGARGAKISDEVREVVEPKLEKLLKKKEKEEEKMADNFKEVEELKAKLSEYEREFKELKRRALLSAMEGKVPKGVQPLVLELADRLPVDDKIELSDEEGKKRVLSPVDLLIEIFKNLPHPVTQGKTEFSDPEETKVDAQKLLKKI